MLLGDVDGLVVGGVGVAECLGDDELPVRVG